MKFARKLCTSPVARTLFVCLFLFVALLNIAAANSAPGITRTGPGGTIPEAEAELSVIQTESIDPVRVGGALRYTLFVANSGPDEAVDVVVANGLPDSVTLVSTNGCVEDPVGAPTCTLGTLQAGASAQVTVDVIISAGASGLILKEAVVSAATSDPDSSNNTATEVTTIFAAPEETTVPAAMITINNQINGENILSLGKRVSFTLQIANIGGTAIPNLPLTYTYPAAILRYESATIAPDDSINDGQLTWQSLHSQGLAPGANTEVTLEFTTVAESSHLLGGQATTVAGSLNGVLADAFVSVHAPSTIVLTARTVQITNNTAKIQWATADEKTVHSYQIWRQIGSGARVLVTPAIIPANLSGHTGSASYRKEYPFAAANEPTIYLLEIILLSGAIEFSELGTVFQAPTPDPTPTPTPAQPTQPTQPTDSSRGIFLPLIAR